MAARHHAAGFHSGAGPRLCHHIGAVARRSLAGAHHRGRASDRKSGAGYAGRRSRRGLRRLFGRDPNAGGQRCGAVPGVRGTGSPPQERAVRCCHHRRAAQADVRDSGRLHHRDSAAARAGHRHRRRLHHARPGSPGPRPRTLGRRQRRTRQRGAQGAGADAGVLALHRQHAATVRRYRSRQGAETRRADCERQRDHPDLFRLDLRQRLQPVRPHLSRHGPGRFAISKRAIRSGAAAHPQCRGRHGDARQRGGFPRRFRPRPRRALQSLSGGGIAG